MSRRTSTRSRAARKRRVERLAQESIGGIVIFVIGLIVLAALIIHFAPDLLQKVKVRP